MGLLAFGDHEGGIPCPRGVKVVSTTAAREKARSLGISEASAKDPAEASRKAFTRGKEDLIAASQIHESEGWIWLAR